MNPTEEIKNRLDIAEIIGQYINLTPAGGNFKARCPFHNEKTASFMVSKDKQIWHCFGCDKGGDLFSFVQEYEGLSFPETLKVLAAKANIALPAYNNQASHEDYSPLYQINQAAVEFFQNNLRSNSVTATKVQAYLKNRAVSETSISTWQLGLSGEGWDELYQHLVKAGYNEDKIFQAGLTLKKKNGPGYLDRFRRRLMFPILDSSGRPVAFTSRTLTGIAYSEDDLGGKYINSPQTAIYDKSKILYGWSLAKDIVRQKKYLIIVEGNMDAIMSHQAGTANTVAVSGTALTIDHLKLIKRYTDNLILAFDGDAAGSRAAFRSVTLGWAQDMNLKVLVLPPGQDPAAMIAQDKNSWLQLIKESKPVMDYYLQRIIAGVDLNRADHKKLAVAKLLPIIKFLKSKVEQAHYLQALADKLHLPLDVLQNDLAQTKSIVENNDSQSVASSYAPITKKEAVERLSEELLSAVFFAPNLIDKMVNQIEPEMMTANYRDLYRKLIVYYTKHQNLAQFSSQADLSPDQKDSWIKLAMLGERDYANLSDKELAKNFTELAVYLKTQYIHNEREDLIAQLKQAELDNDVSKQDILIHKINLLNKEINKQQS